MAVDTKPMLNMTLEELTEASTRGVGGSPYNQAVLSEFARRQAIAQVEAAKATADTAQWTKWIAILTGLSVFVLAASSAFTAWLTYTKA